LGTGKEKRKPEKVWTRTIKKNNKSEGGGEKRKEDGAHKSHKENAKKMVEKGGGQNI